MSEVIAVLQCPRCPEIAFTSNPLLIINVGFYIGLTADEMEQVLRNEGYTIQCSMRPDDRILFDCFYYSFSRNYASALLKKDGYDGLEIGKG